MNAVWVAPDTRVRFPFEARSPFDTNTEPVTPSAPSIVTPAGLLIIRSFIVLLLNTFIPIVWGADPFNSIVPSEAVKVQLFVIEPAICKVFPEMVKEDPVSIVKLLTVPDEPLLSTGLLKTSAI
jgi:hypothetical protein